MHKTVKDGFYFKDAGSNIGAFTIPVASMKRKVIAVDLMIENLAFIKKSLSFANLTKYVHLVNRAIRFRFWFWFVLIYLRQSFSDNDRPEVYHPALSRKFKGRVETNFGAIHAIKLEDKDDITDVVGSSVESITLADLTKMEPTSTFILKLDLEDSGNPSK